jgi:hypothetical protein
VRQPLHIRAIAIPSTYRGTRNAIAAYMNTMKHIAASLIALAAVLGSVESSAQTRGTTPVYRTAARRPRADQGALYAADIENRMQSARARIAIELQRRQLRPALQQQILNDVSWAMATIRQRAGMYAAKHYVTAAEDADVRALAAAIAGDLQNRYGSLASWYLLA